MKWSFPYRFRHAPLLALLLLEAAGLRAQVVHLKIPITVTDSARHGATVYFGVDPFATYCIDPALGEFELPADRCGAEPLCVYFRDTRPDSAACLGNGLLLNLHAYHSPSQIDTFAVGFSSLTWPITFHWPTTLHTYFDSLRIRDPVTGTVVNVNMLTVDTLVLASPIVDRLLLFSKGPKGYLEGAGGRPCTVSGRYCVAQKLSKSVQPGDTHRLCARPARGCNDDDLRSSR